MTFLLNLKLIERFGKLCLYFLVREQNTVGISLKITIKG